LLLIPGGTLTVAVAGLGDPSSTTPGTVDPSNVHMIAGGLDQVATTVAGPFGTLYLSCSSYLMRSDRRRRSAFASIDGRISLPFYLSDPVEARHWKCGLVRQPDGGHHLALLWPIRQPLSASCSRFCGAFAFQYALNIPYPPMYIGLRSLDILVRLNLRI